MAPRQGQRRRGGTAVIDRLSFGQFRLPSMGADTEVAAAQSIAAAVGVIDFTAHLARMAKTATRPCDHPGSGALRVRCPGGRRAVPLNAGCYRPLQLIVPPGSLPATRGSSRAGGRTFETSQAIANACLERWS